MSFIRPRLRVAWLATLTLICCSLVGAVPAVGASWHALVVNDRSDSDSVTQVDTSSNETSSPVPAGSLPLGIAISPDARTAYVVDVESDELTPMNLTGTVPVAEAPIDLTDGLTVGRRSPNYIAISPDGDKAYISDPSNNQVVPVNLSTNPATVEAAIDVGSNPEGIAFSPDGSAAYVVDNDNPKAPNHTVQSEASVTPIAVATNTPGAAIKGVGSSPFAIAIAPDGKTAYVTENGGAGKVVPIELPSGTVGNPIAVGSSGDGLLGIAISPDGSTAYVSDYTKSEVVPIELGDGSAGTPIALPGTSPYALAITPDSKTLYVSDGAEDGDTVTPVSTQTATVGAAISVGEAPRGIAITPDQAPVANFTVSSGQAGTPTAFDASCGSTPSCSTVPFGTIGSYTWNFGDGSAEVTTTVPTVSHVYAAAATYTATVTESDGLTSDLGEIFTGQTASTFGSPSAQTTRSVVVPAGASQPSVALSVSSLSFGTLGVNRTSAPQSVTLTDSGAAPLNIASVALGGVDPGAFRLTSDSCVGQTLAPGASCAANVTFSPSASGALDATLAFSDNASGSPHTISLAGVATNSGSVSGQVLDASQAGDPPLASAQVQICPQGTLDAAVCQYMSTASNGSYSFANLQPGAWAMQAQPAGGELQGGSAVVQVTPGSQTQNFLLHAPRPLPSGVSFAGNVGTGPDGLPVFFWDSPAIMTWPIYIPPGAPGSQLQIIDETEVATTGGQIIAQTQLPITVRYNASGQPTITAAGAATSASVKTRGAAGWHGAAGSVDQARIAEATNSNPSIVDTLTQIGKNLANSFNVEAAVQSVINIFQKDHGTTQVNNQTQVDATQNSDGTYSCPPDTSEVLWEKVYQQQITGPTNGTSTFKFVCIPHPTKCPRGSASSTHATAADCSNPQPAPNPTETEPTFDPSGSVVTTTGAPVPDGKVILTRSATKQGPFQAVPNDSSIMSAANRRNPDHTTAAGAFDWDVVAGFYRISAQHPGCSAPRGNAKQSLSSILQIPPPAFDLRLVLRCPHLRRARSGATLRVNKLLGGSELLLNVRVAGARAHHPTGLVELISAGKVFVTIPLDRRSQAVFAVSKRPQNQLRVRYLGDGYNAPSPTERAR